MIFRRDRPEDPAAGRRDLPRGRGEEDPSRKTARSPDNPLARRFVDGDEPETIDLQEAPGFPPEAATPQEPPTEIVAGGDPGLTGAALPPGHRPLLTVDPQSGKFYLHPAPDGLETRVGGESVHAPTELRRGDRIRIGDAEFEFLAGGS